jgi:hypothetical protein
MRIIITETQFKRVLLNETKQDIITDEYLDKAVSIVKKLVSRGFSADHGCAMAGNMWAESKFDSSVESPNGAIGLMQWLGDRKKALINFALHKKSKWSNENTQLDFIKIELIDGYKLNNGEHIPNLPKDIKSSDKYEVNNFNSAMKADTIRKKAVKFATLVERCGDCDGTIDIRKESAKRIHDYIAGIYSPTSKKNTKSTEKKQSKNSDKIGSVVYPKKSGDGYVNVRAKADRDSDRIVKITTPNKVGKVTEEKTDSDGNKWYKVTLDKKVGNYTSGWVRSDIVE